ncbi:MAG: single-stranded DNA-binding protein [Chloroflexota bacterium]|nr:single-stranded DNA-binding protein [Chloroflexota bacterium]
MSFDHNVCQFLGRLGRDPETRYPSEGEAVTSFSLATDRPTRPGHEPTTDWHQVVCWGSLAEFAARNLSKGRRVFVAGRLTYQSWEGRDGHKRRSAEVVASEIIPCDRRPDAEFPPSTGEADDV